MGIYQIVKSLAIVAFLILPGFIFGKLKICDSHITKGLSSIVINLCIPALIIDSLQIEFSYNLAQSMFICILMWTVMIIIALFIAFAVKKLMNLNKIETALVICMLSVPNTGFIGIPLVSSLFGDSSLFYLSLCEIANDIFSYTLVLTLVGLSTGYKSNVSLKGFVNPPTLSIVLGIFIFVTGIRLPDVLSIPIEYIADCMTPLAMFIIGAQLSQMKFGEFIGDKRIYILCILRLLFFPAFAFVLLKVIIGIDDMFSAVFILMMGMPAGSLCAIFAENFNGDVPFATKCVMLSNIFCLITIPLFTMLM